MKIIRLGKVEERVDLGKIAIYKRIRAGEFPRPVNLGSNAVGWLEHEVSEWLAARVVERDAVRR